ncbi:MULTISPECIES: hypothetical protein [unclassified Agrococcus]|uniref:hypothetical protein n=1 Tax=unclassified Agrococcus TaxID=2615065 RepID=UPI00361DC5B1
MTPEHADPADAGGIHDTGDLARIWDALEALARRLDEHAAAAAAAASGATHPSDAPDAPDDAEPADP